jgi:hypothetical protein
MVTDGPAVTAPDQQQWLDDEPQPASIHHQKWSLVLRGDSVDDIAFAGAPLLRAVRFVIRDRDWRTVPSTVDRLDTRTVGNALLLTLHAHTDDADVQLEWSGRLELRDNRLQFDALASARKSFLRNRIGIVVLHPAELAGHAVTVRHTSGERAAGGLPLFISPHQPALDVAGMEWETAGVAAQLDFRGDVFEMEDQRNWTDASFKTYSTPLSLPFPVLVGTGAIRQSLELRCNTSADRRRPGAASVHPAIPIRAGRATHRFPAVATGASTAPDALPRPAVAAHTVLVELDLDAANWRAALDRAASETTGPLDVRLIASTPESVADAVAALTRHRVIRMGAFDCNSHVSEEPLWTALRTALIESGSDAEPVGGTRAHFAELNRNIHRIETDGNAITFSVTPQMHDQSRQQVIESIAIQRLVAEQAVAMSGGPVHIGPVTLRPRFNAVATSRVLPGTTTGLDRGYGAHHVPDSTDPRQASMAMGAWLIASAAALAVDGVASLTYCETWGPRGLTDASGSIYPVGLAFEWLAGISGWQVTRETGSQRTDLFVIIAHHAADTVVLAANLGTTPRQVHAQVPKYGQGQIEHLDRPAIQGPIPDIRGVVSVTVPAGAAIRWRSSASRAPTVLTLKSD